MFDNNQSFSQKQTFVRRQWAQVLLFLFFTQHLFQSIWSLLFDVNQSIIFSEMEPEGLKSELLFEDSGHIFCCFCFSLNIFSNRFDHYCLMSINYFLKHVGRGSQKLTFARRQWAQYLLFLFFTQHLFQSISTIMGNCTVTERILSR